MRARRVDMTGRMMRKETWAVGMCGALVAGAIVGWGSLAPSSGTDSGTATGHRQPSITILATSSNSPAVPAPTADTYYQPPQKTGAVGGLRSIPRDTVDAVQTHQRVRTPRTPVARPYTDADAAADVVAAWGAQPEEPGHDCHYINFGNWGEGSTPPGPDLSKVGPAGWVGFTAYAIAGGGHVQYFACYS
jgi:hypothetical protein